MSLRLGSPHCEADKSLLTGKRIVLIWLTGSPQIIPNPDIDHDQAGEDQGNRKPRLGRRTGAGGLWRLNPRSPEGGDVVGHGIVRSVARSSRNGRRRPDAAHFRVIALGNKR